MMLAAVGTTVATHEGGNDPRHEVTSDQSTWYHDSMTVDDDVYVKPNWWDGLQVNPPGQDRQSVGDGLAVNLDNDPMDTAEDRQEIAWLRLEKTGSTSAPYHVEVDTNGPVVAAMDIYEVHDGGTTPDCPQMLVEELYRGEDESTLAWADRLLRETTDYHQRAEPRGSMEVDLFPRDTDEGFIVAIYPMVASGHEAAAGSTGTSISWTVSIDGDSSDRFVVNDGTRSDTQPQAPYDTSRWTAGNEPVNCAERGLKLPPGLQEGDVPELPGQSSAGDTVSDLLGAHIGQ